MGGFNPNGSEVIISVDPDATMLEESVRDELGPTVAHEIHHARRRRAVGYGSTLLQAMISEGLADHFAIEVFGVDAPPWSTALDAPTTDSLRIVAEGEWNARPYDHARWFYGTEPDIPRWTGYTVGFDLVADYLAADPDRRASTLFDAPASRFTP
jgi:uncharacterized protein YjaZ